MTRYAVALLAAALLHVAAFWGWCAFRAAHPEPPIQLAALDLSTVELSLADEPTESEEIQTSDTPPVSPPSETGRALAPCPPSPEIPPVPHEEPDSTPPAETPPDAQLVSGGLPVPVAPPQPSQPPQPPHPSPAPALSARETAHIQAPPAPPSNFRPRYPGASRHRGEEGLVTLEISVNALGRALQVRVLVSSGFPELDAAAVAAVNRARFTPARADGKPVAGRLRLPVEFRLR